MISLFPIRLLLLPRTIQIVDPTFGGIMGLLRATMLYTECTAFSLLGTTLVVLTFALAFSTLVVAVVLRFFLHDWIYRCLLVVP